MPDDLIKLYSPELIQDRELSRKVKVHLEDGQQVEIFFPKSKSFVTEYDTPNGGPFELYVKEWLLRKKEEEIGEYIICG